MYQVTNYINGKECSESNESITIVNPSYGADIGEVLYATKDTIQSLEIKIFNQLKLSMMMEKPKSLIQIMF